MSVGTVDVAEPNARPDAAHDEIVAPPASSGPGGVTSVAAREPSAAAVTVASAARVGIHQMSAISPGASDPGGSDTATVAVGPGLIMAGVTTSVSSEAGSARDVGTTGASRHTQAYSGWVCGLRPESS